MTASTEPRGGLDLGWDPGEDGWGPAMNANLLRLSRLGFHPSVVSMTTATPPGSPISGNGYIIPSGATGAWAGRAGQVAVWDGSAWAYSVPRDGWTMYVAGTGLVSYYGGVWSQENVAALFSSYLTKANPTFTGALKGPYLVLNAYNSGFPTEVGALFRNETEQTYNIVRPDGSTLSIGQENTFPMKNGAGTDLIDGQLVRISGATGANPTVSLASASSHTNASAIGMATQAILNNATGNVATSISIVNTLDTSAYPAGTELFLSMTPGAWSATPPAKPNHRVSIGFVIRQHAVNGAILLWINARESIGELNDVDTTGAETGNGLTLDSDGVWKPKDLLERQAIIDAKQLSGFVDKDEIDEPYDPVTRTVTITHPSGTIRMRFQGKDVSVPSPWVTPAHADTPGTSFFYYSTDGETFAWSTVPFQFEWIQVASARYGTNMRFGVRECHGLMDPEAHRSQHRTVWTYVQSGGTLTGGTYSIGGTASDANNTPGIDAAVLRDEDLPTSIDALPQGSYKVLRPSSGEFAVDTLSFPFTVTPAGYINYYATDAATQGATGKFYNVYVVGIPTTSPSDPYRWVFIAPQAQYDSLDAASAESFEGLRLGDLATGTSEYAPRYRLIYGSNASHATTGKVRLDAVQILERSPLRSTSTSVATLSGTGSTGLPAVWAGPTSLTYQDAATFRSTIGALSAANPIFTGALSGPSSAFSATRIDGAVGENIGLVLGRAGVDRWWVVESSDAESGGDAGSNLQVRARTDLGAEIDRPLVILRPAGGLILSGGSTARPWQHTGALRVDGAFSIGATTVVDASRNVTGATVKGSNLTGTGNRPLVAGADGTIDDQDAATFRGVIDALAATDPVFTGALKQGATTRVTAGGGAWFASMQATNLVGAGDRPIAADLTGTIQPKTPDQFRNMISALSATLKGAVNGVAELGADGRVPTTQLPPYLTLGETAATAHRGDHGVIAYNHSQATGNPHGTTAADVGAAKAPSKQDVSASTTIGSIDATSIKVTATDVILTLSGGTDGQGWDIINPTTATGIAIPSGATLWKSIGSDVGPTTIAIGGGRPIRITRVDANTWTMLGSQ